MGKLLALVWVATLGIIAYRVVLIQRALNLQRAGEEDQAVALRERALQLRVAVSTAVLGTFAVLLTLLMS
jgi:hypothetical protein